MLGMLYPHGYAKSVFCIDFEALYRMGYRGIIFDIDNTLVHHGDDSTPEVDGLFAELKKTGFSFLLLSDNDEARVRRFNKNIGAPYISGAGKPSPEGYLKAAQILGLPKDKIIMIGDQIFTDILGANRSGMASILVHFITVEGETHFGKRRMAEALILKAYFRNKKMSGRLGKFTKE